MEEIRKDFEGRIGLMYMFYKVLYHPHQKVQRLTHRAFINNQNVIAYCFFFSSFYVECLSVCVCLCVRVSVCVSFLCFFSVVECHQLNCCCMLTR